MKYIDLMRLIYMAYLTDIHISFGKNQIKMFMGRKHMLFFAHPKNLEDCKVRIWNQLGKFLLDKYILL